MRLARGRRVRACELQLLATVFPCLYLATGREFQVPGENVRWGTFPSYAVAWIFSEEKFLDWSRGVLDHGKLRVSYGTSGKQFDQPYIAQGVLEPGDLTSETRPFTRI